MKILIANLGSTSFKYRLYDMSESAADMLAKGGFERVTEYTPCIEEMLETLVKDGHLQISGAGPWLWSSNSKVTEITVLEEPFEHEVGTLYIVLQVL